MTTKTRRNRESVRSRRGETSGKGGRCHPQSNKPRDAATLETSRSIMGHGHYDKRETESRLSRMLEKLQKDLLQNGNLLGNNKR
jgi:hypothetical protein